MLRRVQKNISLRACVSQRRWTDKTQKRISLKWIIPILPYSILFLRLSLISAFPLRYFDQCKGMFHHFLSFSSHLFYILCLGAQVHRKYRSCAVRVPRIYEKQSLGRFVLQLVQIFLRILHALKLAGNVTGQSVRSFEWPLVHRSLC